jgi:ABC-type glycerol-3-phosphate transport system substrate-binding protein
LSIRQFILGLLLVIPGIWVLLAPPVGRRDLPPGTVIVEYWEKWTGVEGEQMRQLVNAYNATRGREKGIYVNYISMSAIDRKTLVSTAGGAPPDIAGLWANQIPQYSKLDAFHPLDDLAKEYGITEQTYKPVYWQMARYEGKLWALVSSPAAVVLQWNRRIFWENATQLRAAGLDPSRAPQTIDELNRYAQVLDLRDSKDPSILRRSGYLPTEPGWYVVHTGLWFGTELFDAANNRYLLDTPKSIAAFNWLQSYPKRLGVSTTSNFKSGFGNYTSAENPFLTGRVAMIQQGPWIAIYLEDFKPQMNRLLLPKSLEVFLPTSMRNFNYSWAAEAFPSATGEKDVTLCPFDVLTIPKGAKHKREAFDFMAYMTERAQQEKLAMLHCTPSPLKDVSPGFFHYHPNPYINVFERISAGPNAHHEPQATTAAEMGADLNAMLDKINELRIDVDTGLKQVQIRAQKMLEIDDQKRAIRAKAGQ